MRGGLEGVVSRVLPLVTSTFKPAHNSFNVLDYSSLFEPSVLDNSNNLFSQALGDNAYTITANFYELLSGALVGYTHRKFPLLMEDGSNGYPDLIHMRRKLAIEAKSIVNGRPFDIRDRQFGYLQEFQRLHPSYRVSYAVSRYRTPHVPLSDMSAPELVDFLSLATAYMVVIPLSVVSSLFNSVNNIKGTVSRMAYKWNGSKNWEPRTRVHSSVLNRIAYEPQVVLDNLNINPEDYRISFSISPRNISCQGKGIVPFPIIYLSDRDHKKWVDSYIYKRKSFVGSDVVADCFANEGCSDFPEESALFTQLNSGFDKDSLDIPF